ncbi:MAG: hypothetical protein Q7U40_10510, partial [Desulfatirhabdiaceae bacterium]|nr:hypothetical protein [Desulfatirhabdiaceae bacterium]
ITIIFIRCLPAGVSGKHNLTFHEAISKGSEKKPVSLLVLENDSLICCDTRMMIRQLRSL